MAKAYWVSCYRSITNPDAVAEYAKLAGPAILAAGGKFLARGNADAAYEAGLKQRIVIVEFPSVEAAVACHDGPATRPRSRCSTRPASATSASSPGSSSGAASSVRSEPDTVGGIPIERND